MDALVVKELAERVEELQLEVFPMCRRLFKLGRSLVCLRRLAVMRLLAASLVLPLGFRQKPLAAALARRL